MSDQESETLNAKHAQDIIECMDVLSKQVSTVRNQNTWAIWANPAVNGADAKSLTVQNGKRLVSDSIEQTAETMVLFMASLGLIDSERMDAGKAAVAKALTDAIETSVEQARLSEIRWREVELKAKAERKALHEAGALRA